MSSLVCIVCSANIETSLILSSFVFFVYVLNIKLILSSISFAHNLLFVVVTSSTFTALCNVGGSRGPELLL